MERDIIFKFFDESGFFDGAFAFFCDIVPKHEKDQVGDHGEVPENPHVRGVGVLDEDNEAEGY
jgi:hypothetical protein